MPQVKYHWLVWRQQNAYTNVEFPEREMSEFILPLLWPPNWPDSNPADYSVWSILQEKVYKTRLTDLDDFKHRIRIRTEWATLSLLQLCISSIRVFQPVSWLHWAFRALLWILTLCFCDNDGLWSLRWLVESNSCRLIFWTGVLAVVSYDAVSFNTRRSFNSQGKVVTLFRCGGHLLC